MLDAAARRLIDPPLNRLGRGLANAGVTANAVTVTGLGFGLLAALLIAFGAAGLALWPLLAPPGYIKHRLVSAPKRALIAGARPPGLPVT